MINNGLWQVIVKTIPRIGTSLDIECLKKPVGEFWLALKKMKFIQKSIVVTIQNNSQPHKISACDGNNKSSFNFCERHVEIEHTMHKKANLIFMVK